MTEHYQSRVFNKHSSWQPKGVNIGKDDAVIGIFNSHTEAETSIKELQRAGFDMKKLSIVGKDYHPEEHVVGYYNTGDRMKFWGKQGAFWGGFWGLLFGSAFFKKAWGDFKSLSLNLN